MADTPKASGRLSSVTSDTVRPSPFFYSTPTAAADNLAVLHLKRDALRPVKLRTEADDGYAEGAVTNTRFGSFPHSTLIGLAWGSQVRASRVDTGSRGRKSKKGKKVAESPPADVNEVVGEGGKRKREDAELEGEVVQESKRLKSLPNAKWPTAEQRNGDVDETPQAPLRAPIEAGSGFIHLLQPTPEAWTSSLDHRTQVVYTPDYSYILARLRTQPGSRIIEAGSGSGSFTHAAARAVFNGYPDEHNCGAAGESSKSARRLGRVYSYEFHAPRVETLRKELTEHALDGVVHLTHRDVCADGFSVCAPTSVDVEAIFLDLPAPWLALRHLTRSITNSPLRSDAPVHLCTFSPCIEQVIATINFLRKHDWTEIEMVEVQNRRIDVRREQVGLQNEGLRGVNASAASVGEAVARLREVEHKLADFHAAGKTNGEGTRIVSKLERLESIKKDAEQRKLHKEGNLVHRTEPEVRTHTSYLVFAILPREWKEEDDVAASEQWPVDELMRADSKSDADASSKYGGVPVA